MMGKRDVYAHLMDLQAAVERQKTQITELANHASEERGARLIAEARLDAVEKYADKCAIMRVEPTTAGLRAALEQKDAND